MFFIEFEVKLSEYNENHFSIIIDKYRSSA